MVDLSRIDEDLGVRVRGHGAGALPDEFADLRPAQTLLVEKRDPGSLLTPLAFAPDESVG